ncbi:MAG: hypothetical protein HC853_15770 [Anaerolineae bacterium]|nr:hypothetical protein [Anaerolineae bacterium]
MRVEVGAYAATQPTLKARLYPDGDLPPEALTLSRNGNAYEGTFPTLGDTTIDGHVHVWAEGATPRREAIVAYSMGGNPGKGRNGNKKNRKGHAPALSPDGQMIFYTRSSDETELPEGQVYVVQGMAGLPAPPPVGRSLVGLAYNLVASPRADHHWLGGHSIPQRRGDR